MSRAIAYLLIGLLAAGFVSGLYTGLFAAPPFWFTLGFTASCLVVSCAFAFRRLRAMYIEDRLIRSDGIPNDKRAAALRLLGDYPPYVIEAAREIGDSRDPTFVPLMKRAAEQVVREKPGGWREMAAAMVDALLTIGAPGTFVFLRRLESLPGGLEVENLTAALDAFEQSRMLLRPTKPEDDVSGTLLRPITSDGSQQGDDQQLLRSITSSEE